MVYKPTNSGCGLEHGFYFPIQLGMSSSQLTFIFFRGVAQPPIWLLTRHWVLKRGWSDGGSRGRGGQAVHAMGDSSRKESKSCPSAKTINRSLTHLKLPNIQKPNESNFQNHIPHHPQLRTWRLVTLQTLQTRLPRMRKRKAWKQRPGHFEKNAECHRSLNSIPSAHISTHQHTIWRNGD